MGDEVVGNELINYRYLFLYLFSMVDYLTVDYFIFIYLN